MSNENVMMMVELGPGYGDGYGVVEYRDGKPVIQPSRKGPYATIPAGIVLFDSGVRVAGDPILRVIGPVDGPAAARIRAERYTKNWMDRQFLDKATDDELLEAMSPESERDVYATMCQLRKKYT